MYIFLRQTTPSLAGHEKLDTCRPQNVIGQVGHKNFDSFSHRGVGEAVCTLCILMSFFNKKILNKNNSNIRLISFITLILVYSLIITNLNVNIFNFLFQVMSILIMLLIFFNIKYHE